MSLFHIDIHDSEFDSMCPRIVEFPEITAAEIFSGNTLVTNSTEISLSFNYPLSTTATFKFTNPNGFTKHDFLKCVYDGYTRIYKEEEEAVGNPGKISGMMNRRGSAGPYGIWGHDIEDLYFEGAEEISPENYHVYMGS